MSYYPPWFDLAEWILIAAGILCWLVMKAFPLGRTRGLLKLCGCLAFACGCVFGGTAGLLFNQRAPHLTASGRIANVHIHTGKSGSTAFELLDSPAHDRLNLPSAQSAIIAGESADVIYQAQSGLVLSLHITSGPRAGFDFTESDSTFGAIAALAAALVLALYGVLNFLSDGTGRPARRDNSPAPSGDADTRSIIDL